MSVPTWFSSLVWSNPLTVEQARSTRSAIPQTSGVYCFTKYAGPLQRNTGVLYVGMAGSSIQKRVSSYLVDPASMPILGRKGQLSSSLRHAGKVQLLTKLQQQPPGVAAGIWIRWLSCSGPKALETQLIRYLRPAYNTSENLD